MIPLLGNVGLPAPTLAAPPNLRHVSCPTSIAARPKLIRLHVRMSQSNTWHQALSGRLYFSPMVFHFIFSTAPIRLPGGLCFCPY
ncbi:hypothetical protein EV401DRAFT_89347 [Pisolithus croceorrhizus]|nr:hypothetical protein EV401DRAFT_89347 [Pisolithus croceorrhizus]